LLFLARLCANSMSRVEEAWRTTECTPDEVPALAHRLSEELARGHEETQTLIRVFIEKQGRSKYVRTDESQSFAYRNQKSAMEAEDLTVDLHVKKEGNKLTVSAKSTVTFSTGPCDLGKGRRCTDPFFAVLFFVGAIVPQLSLASLAVQSRMSEDDGSMEEFTGGTILSSLMCAMTFCAILGLVFLQLLRRLPIPLLVYGTIFGAIALLVGFGFTLQYTDNDDVEPKEGTFDAFLEPVRDNAGFLFFGLAAIGMLIVLWYRKEIRLSIAVLKSTSAFLYDAPAVPALYPAIFAFMHLVGLIVWVLAVHGFIVVVSTISGSDATTMLDVGKTYVGLVLLLLLAYFWGNCFITALSSYCTAAATAQWYFAQQEEKKKTITARALLRIVRTGLWHHGGSLAFGSLLLALLQLVKILFFWSREKHQRSDEDSKFIRTIYFIREKAAGMVEFFAKRACRQAYVEVAVHNSSFLKGAADACKRAAEAPKRIMAVEAAGMAYRVVSQLVLVVGVGFAAAWYFDFQEDDAPQPTKKDSTPSDQNSGSNAMIPLCCLGAWLVADSILHPVSIATSTILHCLLVDQGKHNLPHTPLPLRQMLDKEIHDESSWAKNYPGTA